MIHLRPYQTNDVPALLAIWNRRWGNLFPLDLPLWQQNTTEDPVHFRPDLSAVLVENGNPIGYAGIKTPPSSPAWQTQDLKTGWISVLLLEPGRESELAPPLLEHATNALRDAGMEKISYAADPAHFFPGVPEPDQPLKDALATFGFQIGGVSYDLFRDISDYELPEQARQSLESSDFEIAPCTINEVPALIEFLTETFPGRWLYDTQRRLSFEATPDDILLLRKGEKVYGFCHIHHRGSRFIGPNIYWRGVMGNAYGGLGPIGVSAEIRGQGLGFALLCYAVQYLKEFGVRPMAIDWTGLVDFYGKIGFTIWRTYQYAFLTTH
jgi:GNAT superfamily N-acetyltransferase